MVLYRFISRYYSMLIRRKRDNYIHNLVQKGLKLGKDVEIIDTFFFDPSHCFLISIGDNCTICPNVRLIAHDASTKKHLGFTKIGRIEIGDNCFLGDSIIVLPGVIIGPNSIIGAASVVTGDIPDGSVAAGNPARVIMSTKEYLEKISSISGNKRVFTEDYFIDKLNELTRQEIIDSVGNSIGFIV